MRHPVTRIYAIAAGEYVQLEAFQDSGGAINSKASTPMFGLTFRGV